MFFPSVKEINIILYKAKIHLISEASSTYLSYLWWIFEPLISLGIYYLVFGVIFQRGTEDFIPFLLVGLVTWQWFSQSIEHCANSINGNVSLICNIKFRKLILPSINIAIDTVKFFIVFFVLLVFLWCYGYKVDFNYIYLPLVLISQFIINTVFSFIVAAIIPFFPDLKIIVSNGLRVAFFLSGILYSVHDLPSEYSIYFEYNPMTQIISMYRAILMNKAIDSSDILSLSILLCITIIILQIIIKLVERLDNIFPRVLLQK